MPHPLPSAVCVPVRGLELQVDRASESVAGAPVPCSRPVWPWQLLANRQAQSPSLPLSCLFPPLLAEAQHGPERKCPYCHWLGL